MMTQTAQSMNPRFASAVYFALLGLVFLLLAKYIMLSLASNLNLPLMPMILTAMITGALAGALFGNWLAKPHSWWQLMLLGCALAIVALLQITGGILFRAWMFDNTFAQHLNSSLDYLVVFGLVFLTVTLIVGVWMIPLTGLAAIYFNKHFLPGLLAVDVKRHQNSAKPNGDSDKQND